MKKNQVPNDWYYLLIPHFIIVRKDLTLTEKAILGIIYSASMHNELKECQLSYSYISACLNLSKRQVINIILNLHNDRYLRMSHTYVEDARYKNYKNRNTYTLFFDGSVLLDNVSTVPMPICENGENISLKKGEKIAPQDKYKNINTHIRKENYIKELELKPSFLLTQEESKALLEYYKNKYDLLCKIAQVKVGYDD